MAEHSKIEWTDSSWNPIRAYNLKNGKVGWHCEHATTGCEFCYAESMNRRLGTRLPFKPGHRKDIEIFLDEKMLIAPLYWKKPRMVFVCSMTDLFADFVRNEWIDKVFAVMALCPQHTFQVLTKRTERMCQAINRIGRSINVLERCAREIGYTLKYDGIGLVPWPLPNVWLGVSCERQQEADERIPHLLNTPAAIRFISAEPLLGPIDLTSIKSDDYIANCLAQNNLLANAPIDWVICGGESGPNARPMHPDWARSIRDQCRQAGVAFFFKQWGEWAPGECADYPATRTERVAYFFNNNWNFGKLTPRVSAETHFDDQPDVYWLGKKAAGRVLDGVEHNEFPR